MRHALVALLLALAPGCARDTETWIADLDRPDPWRRRMAALALRSVADDDVERAFRVLAVRLKERDPEVHDAMLDTLAVLTRRSPELPARALAVLPPEQQATRLKMARLLLEPARSGEPGAREALEAYLQEEERSGVPARAELVGELRAEWRRVQDGG